MPFAKKSVFPHWKILSKNFLFCYKKLSVLRVNRWGSNRHKGGSIHQKRRYLQRRCITSNGCHHRNFELFRAWWLIEWEIHLKNYYLYWHWQEKPLELITKATAADLLTSIFLKLDSILAVLKGKFWEMKMGKIVTSQVQWFLELWQWGRWDRKEVFEGHQDRKASEKTKSLN